MAENAPTQDLSENTQSSEELPAKLRVHSLARVLGTTSKRIVDALAELDGRARSPHSTVERAQAEQVREVLNAEAAASAVEVPVTEPPVEAPAEAPETPVAETPTAEPEPAQAVVEEPESRLLLEAPPAVDAAGEDVDRSAEPAPYLPLFVAPQPVTAFKARPVPVPVHTDDADDADDADDDTDEIDSTDGDDDAGDDDQSERPAARRRRRGRRGRGRGRGEQSAEDGEDNGDDVESDGPDQAGSEDSDGEDADSEDNDADDDGGEGGADSEAGSRRRRRRRRRKSGGGDSDEAVAPDDPPNTVVHERAPREKSAKAGRDPDEIQGISGSTRLEAKRQRRRDGRDAGRRRPPILSEAEFLARREAVERTMIVRDKIRSEPPHEGARYTQIAVLEDGVVVEHFVTSAASASLVGNIYLGIVQNVLPSMEAAFVDIGRGRNGVLYAGEVDEIGRASCRERV